MHQHTYLLKTKSGLNALTVQLLSLGAVKSRKRALEALAPIKFWLSDGSIAWYAAASDGKDTFFGVVSENGETELRRFTRDEIEDSCGMSGSNAKIDESFTPQSLRDLLAGDAG